MGESSKGAEGDIGEGNNEEGNRAEAYEMWLAESDPDDVDYVGDEMNEGTMVTDDEDSDRESDEGDEDGSEDDDVFEDAVGDDFEEADEDGNENDDDANTNVETKKRKKKTESEDEEDLFERFEYEIEDSVAAFIDELPIGRDEMPDSSDEDEDPMLVRDRRIRRGNPNRLGLGNIFFTAVEFKEAVLDYALMNGKNIEQERYDTKNLAFKCAMSGCEWRVY